MLARGFLAGNRRQREQGRHLARPKTDEFAKKLYYREDDFAVVERLGEVAAARGVPNTQIALAWVLAKSEVTALIIGASRLEHLDDAQAALSLQLTPDEIRRLEEPYKPHPVLGHE